MRSPYKAKSLTGAQARVRQLLKQQATTTELLDRYAWERVELAKLASKTPMFFNPLDAIVAGNVRDRILREKGLIPHAKP